MRFINILRHITVAAWSFRNGEDIPTYLELVPGQCIRVRGCDGDCFRFAAGWAELPDDVWTWHSSRA